MLHRQEGLRRKTFCAPNSAAQLQSDWEHSQIVNSQFWDLFVWCYRRNRHMKFKKLLSRCEDGPFILVHMTIVDGVSKTIGDKVADAIPLAN